MRSDSKKEYSGNRKDEEEVGLDSWIRMRVRESEEVQHFRHKSLLHFIGKFGTSQERKRKQGVWKKNRKWRSVEKRLKERSMAGQKEGRGL